MDLAQALRRAGINAVFFGYRGAWGSEGNFSYQNCIDDTNTLIDFFKQPANIEKFRIDPAKFIVMGHSMGGFVTMNVAKAQKDVKAYVYLSGWNVGYEAERLQKADADAVAKRKQGLAASAAPLKGTNAELLYDEILSMKDTHNLVNFVPELAGKKFLMVTAKKDTACPAEYDHIPLYDALKKAYPNDVSEFTLDTDHVYSVSRVEMIRGVFEWLQSISY
ncbi:hypothetical protein FACS1894187_14990 [Synergistales bacterium]|nr:hypothetical protein FACS1894187_14990 [Synergistales bacterium]